MSDWLTISLENPAFVTYSLPEDGISIMRASIAEMIRNCLTFFIAGEFPFVSQLLGFKAGLKCVQELPGE